jgi:uncharacterized UBP type Zn finger protein
MSEKNKDNNMGDNNNGFQLEETPKGESGEIRNYYEDWEKQKDEEKVIKEGLKRQKTLVYSREIKKFSYSDFTKPPTTFIFKQCENSNTMTYMTTVIQCLASIPPLTKYFLKNKKFFVENMFKCPFNYYFSRFISKIYSYPEEQDKQFYQTFNIDDFRNLLVKKNKIFQGSSTKDAEKFLVFFCKYYMKN